MNLSAIIANFQTFKLVDLLDIIIVAFVIYQLLGFINRTRAGQLARGALVVMVIYLIATTLNMRMVTWIMDALFQVGLLTLVVLFQPEIRRALEQMGQTDQWASKLFSRTKHVDPSLRGVWRSAIIAICDAAERFSETKTGALIVLERHTNLSEIKRTGTPVNSEVNLELLGTIFYEGTPLHDGAAIIEDGVAKLPDRSAFAGSVCTTDRVVRSYVTKTGATLPEAVQIMTLTPARLMKIDDRKGSIAPGKDADIVLFDDGINVSLTMIGGRVVYGK